MFKNTQVNCVTDRMAVLFAAVYRLQNGGWLLKLRHCSLQPTDNGHYDAEYLCSGIMLLDFNFRSYFFVKLP